jgi:hypothetical protein
MVNVEMFKAWLKSNTTYSEAVISDTISRVKRADKILEWNDEETYFFYLEQQEQYKGLSVSVRSQIKKSVMLYRSFRTEQSE